MLMYHRFCTAAYDKSTLMLIGEISTSTLSNTLAGELSVVLLE